MKENTLCYICFAGKWFRYATHTCEHCRRAFCDDHWHIHEALWSSYYIAREEERKNAHGNNERVRTRP